MNSMQIITLYTTYTLKSIIIFTLCFVLGVIIDNQFSKIQSKYPKANRLMLAILQLLTIITVTFMLGRLKFYHIFLEIYNPNILFSSFLFSLQSNMINNFKNGLGSVIYNYVNL
jgi:hypothetical protein